MKSLYLALALVLIVGGASAQTQTPNLGLWQFPHNFPNYDVMANGNMQTLDNLFALGTCGVDGIHALSYDATLKKFGCNALSANNVSLAPLANQIVLGQRNLFLNGGNLTVTNTLLTGFDDALEALGVPIVSTSTPNERYNGHYSEYGWSGTSPTAGIESSGYFAQAFVEGGSTTGNLVGFLDFQPHFAVGSTVFTYLAYYCDHAAVSSTQVTGPHVCFSGYTGAGGWGGDFYGSGTGGSVALGIGRICHSTDAIANGGTPTDCWYAKGIFSSLPTCSSTNEGSRVAVTDSSTNTWGATITGSSTNHVLAYCDGTNWTVAAK